jgi:flagellar biosynthesis/type III secretory pathway protein FliH
MGKTQAVLLLSLFIVFLTVTIANAQQQEFSPAPNCYKSGYDYGYQKGYSNGYDIGYHCLIPSIHYPTYTYNLICTGLKTDFENGFKAGYRDGYNAGYNAGEQYCLQ